MNARARALFITSFVATACADPERSIPDAAVGEPQHLDEPEHAPVPTRVNLSPDVVEAARIRWAPAAREPLERVVELPGEVVADPDRTARIVPPADGIIERVDFREGDHVAKGSVLSVLRMVDLPERRAAASAQAARAHAAAANAARLEALAKRGLASEQEAATARAEADAVAAEADAARQRLGALGTRGTGAGSALELRTPIAGTIIERHAVVGDRASVERPLATVVDLSQVWFLGRVFERDLASIRTTARAEVELNAYPDQRFDGRVEYLAQQIDPVARTVVARVTLENHDGLLRLGLFGTARVALGRTRDTPSIVVPRSAVTDLQSRPIVFVRHSDGDFERHDVTLGDDALGKVEILSGLREGEEVVTEGVFTLKSAVLRQTFGEEEE